MPTVTCDHTTPFTCTVGSAWPPPDEGGAGTQEPLWDRLGALACPVLALAGSDDVRFASHALRIAARTPHGVASLVPGGGHAVHLAQPAQAGRIVGHWLDAV